MGYSTCFSGDAWFTSMSSVLEALLRNSMDCIVEVYAGPGCITVVEYCGGYVAVMEEKKEQQVGGLKAPVLGIKLYAAKEKCKRLWIALARGGG